ncbi:MAG: DUF4139 domain-containing protein [Planctomycetes bacterium]|nr:DUF4139 domain-containing protein [Planctomycetota bacterium]
MNRFIAGVLFLTLVTPGVRAQEPPTQDHTAKVVTSTVRSVGLFKNGLAVVQREVWIPADGGYELDDVPAPVHGTLWIESEARVETRVTRRPRVIDESRRPGADLQTTFAGRYVDLTLRDPQLPVSGRVVAFAGEDLAFDRNYERSRREWWWNPGSSRNPPAPDQRFLVLETEHGTTFIDRGQITRIDFRESEMKPRTELTPVLAFVASDVPSGGATIRVSYLTKGIGWAPGYRLELGDHGELSIEQQATIRNELEDLHGVEVELISGFPSIEFAHVLSPMSTLTDWSQFFNQLAQRFGNGSDPGLTSQAVMYNAAPTATASGPIVPSVEGVDSHYQRVGKRSLELGDSLVLDVARATTPYQRIVEWTIPDQRDAYGRYVDPRWNGQELDDRENQPWDAVRFDNPFPFPMTTGAATVVADGRFRGQRMTSWVNVGETTTLPINKALSVRTLSTESEEPETRDYVRIGGNNHRRTTARGELLICNHRKEAVTMVIRRRFSGQLLSADESPTESLREEGVYSVNQRNELQWTIELAPGEQKTLTYRYELLVRS